MLNDPRLKQPSVHLALVAVVSVLVWSYWPGWLHLWATWQSDPDYNHGFLVIPISIWLLWQRREQLAEITIQPSWLGVLLIGLSVAVRLLGAEFFFVEFDTWSIPIWIAGVVLLFGGWQLLKWSAGAIAFLWFMTPLPGTINNLVSLPLQKVSAVLSTWILHLFAQPAVRQGTTISLGAELLEVERACSGLRICYGILALAVAYVILSRPGRWRSAFLIAVAIPVAILANSVRVTMTGLLYMLASGEAAQRFSHDFAGLIMLPLAVLILWCVHQMMERVIAAFQRSSNAGVALVLKSAVVLIVVSIGMVYWQRKQADAAVGTLLNVAERYEAEEQWGQAASFLDRYCRVRPDELEPARRLAQIIEKISPSPAYQARAARVYARAWQLDPADLSLGLAQGRTAREGQLYSLAIAAANTLLEQLDPSDMRYSEAYQLKIEASLNEMNQISPSVTWNDITELLTKAIDANIEPATNSLRLAFVYREKVIEGVNSEQRIELADGVLRDLKDRYPQDPLSWFVLYQYKQLTGQASGDAVAEEDLNTAIQLASDLSDAKQQVRDLHGVWLAAAERSFQKGDFEQSRTYYERSQLANPDHFRSYLQLARLATMAQPDAVSSEQNAGTAEGAAVSRIDPAQHQKAVEILRQGLARDPLKDEMLLNLTLVASLLQSNLPKNVAEANTKIRDLRSQFRQMNPQVGIPLQLTLALAESEAYAQLGQHAKASTQLEAILTSDDITSSGIGGELLGRAWMTLGGYFEQQQLGARAVVCYNRAAELEPTSLDVTVYRALSEERSSNAATAADLYEEVARRLGDRPGPWLGLARNELRKQLDLPQSRRNFTRFDNAISSARTAGAAVEETALLEAEGLTVQDQRDRARSVLNDAVQQVPGSPVLFRALATLAQAAGDQQGMEEALAEYRQQVEQPLQAFLLEADLLADTQRWDQARDVLLAAAQSVQNPDEQRQLNQRLAAIAVINNQPQDARQLLEKFTTEHPDDRGGWMDLGDFLWRMDDLDGLVEIEEKLKSLDGEQGAAWKEMKARRLLLLALRAPETEPQRSGWIGESRQLVQKLQSESFNPVSLQVLLGRLAVAEQQLDVAAGHFRQAWEVGGRSSLLASELVSTMLATGDAADVNRYMSQMRNFLYTSPVVFDAALVTQPATTFDSPQEAAQIARRWTETIGDAASFIRLARALTLTGTRTQAKPAQLLDEAEAAYRRAIELDRDNPQNWGEYLRFIDRDRRNRRRAITELNQFVSSDATTELERSFVAAQLLAEFGQRAAAIRFWHDSAERALKSDKPSTTDRVLAMAAAFFAGVHQETAEQLTARMMETNAAGEAAVRMRAAVLVESNNADSLQQALDLLAAQKFFEQPATDSDRRLIARLLSRHAEAHPDDARTPQHLVRAQKLLAEITAATDGDTIQRAQITRLRGDVQAAFLILSSLARGVSATPFEMRVCVEFWQDKVNDPDFFSEHIREILERIERTAGAEVLALNLRLRPKSLDADQRFQITRDFLKRAVVNRTNAELRNQLLQQTLLYLVSSQYADVAMRLMDEDLKPCTDAQKLTDLLIAGVLYPAPSDFYEQLSTSIQTLQPKLNNAGLDRAAADFYFMQGRFAEAEPLYRSCLARNSKDIGCLNNLALTVAELHSDFSQALQLMEQAMSAAREDADEHHDYLLDTQAQLLLASGQTQQALEMLQELAATLTADASVFLHLAETQRQLGQNDDSLQSFRTFHRMQPNLNLLPPMDRTIYDRLQEIHGATTLN